MCVLEREGEINRTRWKAMKSKFYVVMDIYIDRFFRKRIFQVHVCVSGFGTRKNDGFVKFYKRM